MRYRAEIDGLRALAVIPVVLFHAGIPHASGGFVGVDVFFVISGYLMAIIILGGMRDGTFSVLGFYERRARRILPALMLVMACCLPFAWMWMTPPQLAEFAESVVAASLFVSNLLFWKQSGYFGTDAETLPLLHTWSLAIEEQYYLFAPFVTLVFWRFGKRNFAWLLATMALASLALCEWSTRNEPDFAFFFTLTRIWELLAGALCGLALLDRPLRPSQWLSAAGLGLILLAIFGLEREMPYPSLYTLLPVGGTALIILYAGAGTWAGRILSHPLPVGIGLISYSTYLWHQPLLAFARLRSIETPSQWTMLALSLAALALGYLTWRFVERPFRGPRPQLLRARKVVLATSAATLAAMALLATPGILTEGFPNRAIPSGGSFASLDLSGMLANNSGLDPSCRIGVVPSDKCRTGDNPELILWGDSFAMHLAPALTASKPGLRMIQLTLSSCSPVIGMSGTSRTSPPVKAQACIDFNDRVLDWIERNPEPDIVVISSAFTVLGGAVFLRDGRIVPSGDTALLKPAFQETVDRLTALGKKVVLVSNAPAPGFNVGDCLAKSATFGLAEDRCDFDMADLSGWMTTRRAFYEEMSRTMPVIMLDELVCDRGRCDTRVGDIFVYRDAVHLSSVGSALLGVRNDFYEMVLKATASSPSGPETAAFGDVQ